MSFRLAVEAFDAKVGNPLRKLVLLKLADQANDDGLCWPSYETIAKACEVDRRSVIRHIKKLEEDSFLRIEKVYDKEAKKNKSNRYHLTIAKGVKKSLVTESHYPSDTESPLDSDTKSPPSDTESPKPIIESISKSINEAEGKKNSDDNAEKVKDSNAEFIVNWQPPTRETMEAKLLMAGTPMQMTDGQYQLYVDDFKAHFEERAKDGHPLKSDGKCQAKLRDWLQRERESHIKNSQAQQTNYQGNNHANHQSANSQHQPKRSQADSYAANLDAQLAAERAAREREYS